MAARKGKKRGKAGAKRRKSKPKRGRPALRVTRPMRESVERWRASGMSEEDIALALKITRPTLRKHFRLELKTGHAVKRARAIDLIWQTAELGNVSAQRKLIDMTKVVEDPATPLERAADPNAPPKLKTIAKGKKAQAEDDATTAHLGTDWEGLLDVDPKTAPKN
jgi:hypothetical protein